MQLSGSFGCNSAAAFMQLGCWTTIPILKPIKRKVATAQRAIVTFGLVPYWHMRCDTHVMDHPGQQPCQAICSIAHQALWLDVEALLDPFNHQASRMHFVWAKCRCRFHIHDNAAMQIQKNSWWSKQRTPDHRVRRSTWQQDRSPTAFWVGFRPDSRY